MLRPQSPGSHSAEPLMDPHSNHHLINELLGKRDLKKKSEITTEILPSTLTIMDIVMMKTAVVYSLLQQQMWL